MTHQTPEPAESVPVAPHPSVDQLADLHEELLAPAESQAVREHLSCCPHCAQTLAALADLTELLGAEPPPAMPASVALRIDAALAAEAQAATGPALPHGPATPARAPLSAPPTRLDRQTRPGRPAARRRVRLLLATASCLAVFGLGVAVVNSGGLSSQGGSASSAARPAAGAAQPADAMPGPDFTAAQLPAQVQQLLAARSTSAAPHLPHASAERAPTDGTGSPLPPCVQAAVGEHAGDAPLTVGHGRFGAVPVDVYVFPTTGDPARLDVYLLSQGCALSAPQGTASLLLHQVVPAR